MHSLSRCSCTRVRSALLYERCTETRSCAQMLAPPYSYASYRTAQGSWDAYHNAPVYARSRPDLNTRWILLPILLLCTLVPSPHPPVLSPMWEPVLDRTSWRWRARPSCRAAGTGTASRWPACDCMVRELGRRRRRCSSCTIRVAGSYPLASSRPRRRGHCAPGATPVRGEGQNNSARSSTGAREGHKGYAWPRTLPRLPAYP